MSDTVPGMWLCYKVVVVNSLNMEAETCPEGCTIALLSQICYKYFTLRCTQEKYVCAKHLKWILQIKKKKPSIPILAHYETLTLEQSPPAAR